MAVVTDITAVDGATAAEPEPGTSDGQRLRGRGASISLAGEMHRLVFNYEAIERLEDEFGSLQDFQEALRAGRHRAVISGIAACLLHELDHDGPAEVAALRRHVQRKLSLKVFDQNLDSLWSAITEALPAAKPQEEDDPKSKGSRAASPGNGSTSRRVASGARTKSSGR